MKNHILPRFGSLLLADIAPLHVEELLQAKNTLAAKTVRNLLALVQSVFSLALDLDLVTRSPIKKKHKPALRRREKSAWSGVQVRAIIDAVPAPYRALFYCIALTGIRVGELLALR